MGDTHSDEDLWHIRTPEACCHIACCPGPCCPLCPSEVSYTFHICKADSKESEGTITVTAKTCLASILLASTSTILWTSPPSPAHAPWPASTPSCALPCSLMPPSLALAPSALEPSGLSTAFARPLRPLQRPWSWSGRS